MTLSCVGCALLFCEEPMLITKPSYFDDFRCIASLCPDSCCKEWDVQVDARSAAFYRDLPGALGDRLREVLYEEDGETYLAIAEGRCPMWRADGLCRIQAELGEGALCKTCRDFPRLTHDYGDFVERGLELSCPEAARIILSAAPAPFLAEEVPGGEEPDYDLDAMTVLKATRQTALSLLENPACPPGHVLAQLLLYGARAQAELDGEDAAPFDPEAAMDTVRALAQPGDIGAISAFFAELEILTPQWEALLPMAAAPVFPEAVRRLARYFVERYWLQAVSDYDLMGRVKFAVISCILICALPGDFLQNAQLYSKEIENNYSNVEALLDGAYTSPAFGDLGLLGLCQS